MWNLSSLSRTDRYVPNTASQNGPFFVSIYSIKFLCLQHVYFVLSLQCNFDYTQSICNFNYTDSSWNLRAVEDVLKPPGSLLATDRSKAVVLV